MTANRNSSSFAGTTVSLLHSLRNCEKSDQAITGVDTQEFSNLSQDFEGTNTLHRETNEYVEASLGGKSDFELSQISTNPIVASFKPIAEAVTKEYSSR